MMCATPGIANFKKHEEKKEREKEVEKNKQKQKEERNIQSRNLGSGHYSRAATAAAEKSAPRSSVRCVVVAFPLKRFSPSLLCTPIPKAQNIYTYNNFSTLPLRWHTCVRMCELCKKSLLLILRAVNNHLRSRGFQIRFCVKIIS